MSSIEEIHNQRLDSIEIRFYRDKLNEYTKSKVEYIQSKYKRRVEAKKQIPVDNNGSNKSNSISYIHDILFSIAKSNAKFADMASTFKFTAHRTKSEIYKSTNKRSNTKPRQINNIYKNKGVKNDRTRTTTKSGATQKREAKYRAYLKNRKARAGVYQSITADAERLRSKLGDYSGEQQRIKQSIFEKIRDIKKIITKLASELKSMIENMKIREPIKVEKLDFINDEPVNESDKKIRRNK